MRPDPSGVRFFQMSGAGNDFIAVLDAAFLTPERAEALCARGHSIGADGVFSISSVAGSEAPAVRMEYLNADGTPARLCINGTRCAGLLAFHLGWAGDRVTILTGAGAIEATRTAETEVALDFPPPRRRPVETCVDLGDEQIHGWFLDTGVPHFVLEWPDCLVTAPVAELGPELRHAPQFEDGANVDFARFLRPGRIEVRTFERGVEGETLACGTGVLAAAAVAVDSNRSGLPLSALTSGGFELTVAGAVAPNRSITAWSLAGDARLIAEGVLGTGALSIPEPPFWTP